MLPEKLRCAGCMACSIAVTILVILTGFSLFSLLLKASVAINRKEYS